MIDLHLDVYKTVCQCPMVIPLIPRRSGSQMAVLLTVGRSYVGNDVTHSTLLDRACACSYENLPKYRSYRVSVTNVEDLTSISMCRYIVFGI